MKVSVQTTMFRGPGLNLKQCRPIAGVSCLLDGTRKGCVDMASPWRHGVGVESSVALV